jgi:murein DD-endopeptidase MepM/ murein hydrolase activator NlpD
MQDAKIIRSIGDQPPILAEGRRTPDRREVSLRWLSGTFLTGITSSILMGVALFAALEGRELLAIPAEASAMTRTADNSDDAVVDTVQKGGRLVAAAIAAKPSDKSVMDVPTVVVEGEKQVVRKRPFALVKMALAANYPNDEDYPAFDPLNIVSDSDKAVPAAPSPVFYGSDVDSEVSLKVSDFPTRSSPYPLAASMSLDEVEENVRTNGSLLTSDNKQVATLSYVDPQRFATDSDSIDVLGRLSAKVVEENTTVATPTMITEKTPEYADDVLPVRSAASLGSVMVAAGYDKTVSKSVEDYVSTVLQKRDVAEGDVVRIGVIQEGEKARVVRVSLYSHAAHQLTVAIDDKGKLVTGAEPPVLSAVASAFDDSPSIEVSDNQNLPRVYDGIYRAALSYGMSKEMTARVVRLLSSTVDFQARLKPSDRLEAFYSVEDETGDATDESELLYIHAKFGDTDTRLYRFQDPTDMSVDYYDQDGKSLKQFLIRNPLPGGVFKSGFGMRRHPILGYMRMHTGVDWAAPKGTPIIAAGDGVVIKAGWDKGGYGNQTLIQHPNGYVTSYNHQSAIAKDVVEGAHVRQGQIIGWVGTTGESTGPHLHYEVIVNGNKVDPQRIRLPGGKALKGDELAKFEQERKRIDDLIDKGDTKIASQ